MEVEDVLAQVLITIRLFPLSYRRPSCHQVWPVHTCSFCCWSLPQVTIRYPPGVNKLPLFSVRPAVTFPTAEHHRPLASTKLYCLVTEAHRCEQLAQGCYAAFAPSRIWTHDLLIASPILYLLWTTPPVLILVLYLTEIVDKKNDKLMLVITEVATIYYFINNITKEKVTHTVREQRNTVWGLHKMVLVPSDKCI